MGAVVVIFAFCSPSKNSRSGVASQGMVPRDATACSVLPTSVGSVTGITDSVVSGSYAGNIQVAVRQALPVGQSSKGPQLRAADSIPRCSESWFSRRQPCRSIRLKSEFPSKNS